MVCIGLVCGCKHTTDDVHSENSLVAEFKVKDKFGQESTTFVIGDEINFELTITNTEVFDITYETTGPGHNFIIWKGDTIWTDDGWVWTSVQGAYPHSVHQSVIEGKDTIVFNSKWRGEVSETLETGEVVTPGEYIVLPMMWINIADPYFWVEEQDPINITLN